MGHSSSHQRCKSETGNFSVILVPESGGKNLSFPLASFFLMRADAWSFGSHLGLMRFVEQIFGHWRRYPCLPSGSRELTNNHIPEDQIFNFLLLKV